MGKYTKIRLDFFHNRTEHAVDLHDYPHTVRFV